MIKKHTEIPDKSVLKDAGILFHYIDSYQSQYLSGELNFDIINVGNLFFTSGPGWIDMLMAFRDKAVGIFGLKTARQIPPEQKNVEGFKFVPGEQLNIFKLYDRTENELIMGEDDKHLSFRVSLLVDTINDGTIKKRVSLTTAVEFKNFFGRLYFCPVKPFHQLMVKATLKEMIRKIENHSFESI